MARKKIADQIKEAVEKAQAAVSGSQTSIPTKDCAGGCSGGSCSDCTPKTKPDLAVSGHALVIEVYGQNGHTITDDEAEKFLEHLATQHSCKWKFKNEGNPETDVNNPDEPFVGYIAKRFGEHAFFFPFSIEEGASESVANEKNKGERALTFHVRMPPDLKIYPSAVIYEGFAVLAEAVDMVFRRFGAELYPNLATRQYASFYNIDQYLKDKDAEEAKMSAEIAEAEKKAAEKSSI